MKEETLSKKEWMLFNEKGFKTKDVAEAVKKLKEELLYYWDDRIFGVSNLDCANSSVRFREINQIIDKIFGEFPNAEGESVMYEPARKLMNSLSGEFDGPQSRSETPSKKQNEDTHAQGCGKKFDILNYGYVKCGEHYNNIQGLGDNRVVLCPKCQDKKKITGKEFGDKLRKAGLKSSDFKCQDTSQDVCECGHRKSEHHEGFSWTWCEVEDCSCKKFKKKEQEDEKPPHPKD